MRLIAIPGLRIQTWGTLFLCGGRRKPGLRLDEENNGKNNRGSLDVAQEQMFLAWVRGVSSGSCQAQRFFWITLSREWGPPVSWVSSQIMMPP